ncbi:MAG: cation:proton antiporter [Pseudomonadota bacterium]
MDAVLELLYTSSFYEFSAILLLAAFGGIIGMLLRQPLIISFIIVGVLAGPSALGVIRSDDEIALLAKLGIAILLFIVGLKLDLKLIKSLGSMAAIIGITQMTLTVGLGFGLCLALGFDVQTSALIGVTLAFSSTIIIIKILSDKREIDSLHGRIALGVLIVQDLAVVLAMIVLAALSSSGGNEGGSIWASLIQIVVYSAVLLVVLIAFMRFAAMRFTSYLAKNKELLIAFAIAWAVSLAALCDALGLSKELGGLLAGITLASTPYRETIISRLSSLRDFLLLFFFVSLGTQVNVLDIGGSLVPAMIISLFVLLFKPLIIMTMSGVLGYRKRTSFMAGISLAQISEFSMIFAAMAFASGFLDQDALGIVTLVGIITIMASTYLMSLDEKLYRLAEPTLGIFERKARDETVECEEDQVKTNKKYDVILFGLGRYGQAMAHNFMDEGQSVLAVDFDPEMVRAWKAKGHDVVYGDANDTEFFHNLPLKNTRWVISALPQHDTGITHDDPRFMILQGLKDNGYQGKIGFACHNQPNAENFRKHGVDLIFLPFHDASQRAVNMVLEFEDTKA